MLKLQFVLLYGFHSLVFGQNDMNIMVATGYNSGYLDHTEVIDMNSIASCSNLPVTYPIADHSSVPMKHNSKMVICGGATFTSDCYSYSNDRWNLEAFKLEPGRYGATSVEIRPDEWLIMGGEDASLNHLIDTQILKNGIFTQGPDLPEPIKDGSAVMLNVTHLFVAAGIYQELKPFYSPQNYLLDINTEQWTRIANRTLSPYHDHSSGTFYNSTAGEIQVANIGYYGIEVYSPRDDSWHQIPFPGNLSSLFYSVAIENGSDSFILIGGATNLEQYSGDVYSFDENGLLILKENVLRVPRWMHVALPISKDDFICVQ